MKKRTKRIVAMVVCMAIMTSVAVYYDWEKTGNVADENTANVASVATRVADAIKGMVSSKSKDNDNNEDSTDAVEDAVTSPVADTMAEEKIVTNVKGVSFENEDTSKFEADKIYTMTYTTPQDMLADTNVVPSVEMTATGKQLETLAIGGVIDNPLLCDKIPGYIGHAYNFTMEGEFDKAKLIFNVDDTVDMSKEPTIYYYNEDTQCLEELKTTVSGTTISAYTTHFSKYILVYKSDWNRNTWGDNEWNLEKEKNEILDTKMYSNNVIFILNSDLGYVYTGGEFEDEAHYSSKSSGGRMGTIKFENLCNVVGYNAHYMDCIKDFINAYFKNDNLERGILNIGYTFLENPFGHHYETEYGEELYRAEEELKSPLNSNEKGKKLDEFKEFINYLDYKVNRVEGIYSDKKKERKQYYGFDCVMGAVMYAKNKLSKEYGVKSEDYHIRDDRDMFVDNGGLARKLIYNMKNEQNGHNSLVYVFCDSIDTSQDLIGLMQDALDNKVWLYFIDVAIGDRGYSFKEEDMKGIIQDLKETYGELYKSGIEYHQCEGIEDITRVVEKLPGKMESEYGKMDGDGDGLRDHDEYKIINGLLYTGTGVPINELLNLTDQQSVEYKEKGCITYSTGKNMSDTADYDGDGLEDGEELILSDRKTVDGRTVQYVKMLSDPTKKDTDGDGFDDREEKKEMGTNPMRYDITDLTLGYAAWFAYCNVGGMDEMTIREIKKSYPDKLKDDDGIEFDKEAYEALKDFSVESCNESGVNINDRYDSGLGLTIIKKNVDGKNNYIVCCRGQEATKWDIYTVMTILLDCYDEGLKIGSSYNYNQLAKAVEICEAYIEKDEKGSWFVTGHSLGGRLSQDLYVNMEGFEAGASFNGLGYINSDLNINKTSLASLLQRRIEEHHEIVERYLNDYAGWEGVFNWVMLGVSIGAAIAITYSTAGMAAPVAAEIMTCAGMIITATSVYGSSQLESITDATYRAAANERLAFFVYEILRNAIYTHNNAIIQKEQILDLYRDGNNSTLADNVETFITECREYYFDANYFANALAGIVSTVTGPYVSDLIENIGVNRLIGDAMSAGVSETINTVLNNEVNISDRVNDYVTYVNGQQVNGGEDSSTFLHRVSREWADSRMDAEIQQYIKDKYATGSRKPEFGSVWRKIDSKYKKTGIKFDNYYYKQDFLSGELVENYCFSRIGNQIGIKDKRTITQFYDHCGGSEGFCTDIGWEEIAKGVSYDKSYDIYDLCQDKEMVDIVKNKTTNAVLNKD